MPRNRNNRNETLVGGKGSDLLIGGAGDDSLVGRNGNDLLIGGSGDDHVSGGKDNDLILGGSGDDTLSGKGGDDLILGNSGDDVLAGGGGNDVLSGGSGDDTLRGGQGNDIISGGSGDDRLNGGDGDDFLSGGAGDDIITGGGGADTLLGGAGNDILRVDLADGSTERDRIDGGSGQDRIVLSLDSATWARADVRAEMLEFLDHLQSGSSRWFDFSTLPVSARRLEEVTVKVDGIVVDPRDNPVSAEDDSVATTENALLTGNVLENDSAPDTVAAVELVQDVARGQLSLSGDGTFIFDPAADFDRLAAGETTTETFVYRLVDADGDSDLATVSITVTGENDGPVAVLDEAVTDEDSRLVIDVLANDFDPDAGDLPEITSAVLEAGDGMVSIEDGKLVWDPQGAYNHLSAGETATVEIRYEIADATGATSSASVHLAIEGTNDAPTVSVIDGGVTNEDEPSFSLDLLAGAEDPDATDDLDVANPVVTSSDGRTVVFQVDPETGDFSFNPAQFNDLATGEFVSIAVSYDVVDGNGGVAAGSATIVVEGRNDDPLITGGVLAGTVTDSGDGPSGAPDGLVTHRFVTEVGSNHSDDLEQGDQIVGTLTFDTSAHFTTTTDGVTSYYANPAGASFSFDLNGTTYELDVSLIIVSDDQDGRDRLFVILDNDVARLTFQTSPGNSILDEPRLRSDLELDDFDSNRYLQFNLGEDDPAWPYFQTQTWSSEITAAPEPPVLETSGVISFLDGDLHDTHTVSAQPDGGDYVGNLGADIDEAAGSVSWHYSVPEREIEHLGAGETLVQSYRLSIDDGNGGSTTETLTITIEGTNDAPLVRVIDAGVTDEDSPPISIDLLTTARDIDATDDLDTTAVVITASDGRAVEFTVDDETGMLSIDPGQFEDLTTGEYVSLTVAYDVVDGNGGVTPNTATLVVEGRNVAPVATDDLYSLSEDDEATGNLFLNDFDPDGDQLQLSAPGTYATEQGGQITLNANGDFSYRPLGDFSGTDRFVYELSDGNGGADSATATFSVDAVADAPTLSTAAAAGDEDTAIALDISASLADLDGSEVLSIGIAGVPAGASLSAGIDNGGGSWTVDQSDLDGLAITPPLNSDEDFTLTVTVTSVEQANGNTASVTATIDVAVEAVADAPHLEVSASGAQLAISEASAKWDDSGFSPDLAIDGSTANLDGYHSGGVHDYDRDKGMWWQADLGEDQPLSRVRLFWGVTDPDWKKITLSGSLDGVSFSPLVEDSFVNVDGSWTEFELSGSYRFLRVNYVGSAAGGHGLDLLEFEAYGDLDAGPVPLTISTSLVDTDGSESLSIQLSGVPDGASLSAGLDNGDGSWSLAPEDLAGLLFTAADGFEGEVTLTVTSTATESSNGDTASTSQVITLTIEPGAQEPVLVVSDAAGDEDTAIALDISASLADLDGSEVLSIEIAGVPTGASLSAGIDNGGGSWTVDQSDLDGLAITPPLNSDEDFTLTVTATSVEQANGETASVTATIDVAVEAVADAPLLVAPGGNVDVPSGLVAYYAFEGNGNDSSGNGHDGTMENGVAFIDGIVGQAGSFDGIDDQIRISGQAGLQTGYYTVDFYARTNPEQLVGTEGIWSGFETISSTSSEGYLISANLTGDNEQLVYSDNMTRPTGNFGTGVEAGENYVPGSWHRFTYSWDGVVVRGYVDGELASSFDVNSVSHDYFPGPIRWTGAINDFFIGGSNRPGVGNFSGEIDELRVFDRALSDQEVEGLSPGPLIGDEDTAINLDILASLTDLDGSEVLSVVISGVPAGALLSAGVDNGDGSWTLDQTGLEGLSFSAPNGFEGEVTLTVTATATEQSNGDSASTTETVTLFVTADATAPDLIVSDASGDEDTAIALDISASLVDLDGSEVLSIEVSGVPAGASLSAGIDNGGGSWIVDQSDLDGLAITPPLNSDEDFTLTVTATSVEQANGDIASTVASIAVSVAAVADEPSLDVADAAGLEDMAIVLDILPSFTDLDGSELLSIEISGVPTGAFLSAGTDNGGGSWTLDPADLDGLAITPPLNSGEDFTLTVVATTTEQSNGDSASVAATIDVAVEAVADAPVLQLPSRVTHIDDGLVARYGFDGSLDDLSGNGHDGQVIGNPYFTDGVSGQAIDLDGVDDAVRIATDTSLRSAYYTMSMYARIGGDAQSGDPFFGSYYDNSNNATDNAGYSLRFTEGSISTSHFTQASGNHGALGTMPVDDGEWHHIAASWDGTYGKVYVDGILAGEYDVRQTHYSGGGIRWDAPFDDFFVGFNDKDGLARYLDAAIDEVQVYNRALSAAEISQLGNGLGGDVSIPVAGGSGGSSTLPISVTLTDTDGSESIGSINIIGLPVGVSLSAGVKVSEGFWRLNPEDLDGLQVIASPDAEPGIYQITVSTYSREGENDDIAYVLDSFSLAVVGEGGDSGPEPDDGLIAHYSFEGDGTDSSGNGWNAAEFGSVDYVDGVSGQAASLDGSDYLRVSGFDLDVSDFSASMWLQSDDVPSWYRSAFAIHSGGGGTNNGDANISVTYTSGQQVYGAFTTVNGQQAIAPQEFPVAMDQWTHVVFQRDGNEQQLYINGVLVDAKTDSLGGYSITDGYLEIGAPNFWNGGWGSNGRSGAKWQGEIDELRVYDRALSEDEILDLYGEGGFDLISDQSLTTFGGAAAGTIVGRLPDAVDGLSYDLIGDGGPFLVTPSGYIMVADASKLDRYSAYELTVSASNGIASDTAVVTVNTTMSMHQVLAELSKAAYVGGDKQAEIDDREGGGYLETSYRFYYDNLTDEDRSGLGLQPLASLGGINLAGTVMANGQPVTGVYVSDTGNNAVLLAESDVSGVRTLYVSYRGTDHPVDDALYSYNGDDGYLSFGNAYDDLSQINDAISNAASFGYEQVYVTGHSLGSALAQRFMADNPDDIFRAVTFGAPAIAHDVFDHGSGIQVDDSRVLNFVDVKDPVGSDISVFQAQLIEAIATGTLNLLEGSMFAGISNALAEQIVDVLPGATSQYGNVFSFDFGGRDFGLPPDHNALFYIDAVTVMDGENIGGLTDGYTNDPVPNGTVVLGRFIDDTPLKGTGGGDLLIGASGNDTLDGGGGDDILFGGDGADQFRFSEDDGPLFDVDSGNDTVMDFNRLDGDRLDVSDWNLVGDGFADDFETYEEFRFWRFEQEGNDLRIWFDDEQQNSVTLIGLSEDDLDQSDFLF